MNDAGVATSVGDGAIRIVLNRPDRMNILTVDARKKILEVLKANELNDSVCCVVVSSEGKAFSAGADLNYLLALDAKGARAYSNFVRSFLEYVEGYPKPTVGLVDGVAVGGGLELLLTFDLVVSSTRARFGQTEINVGLIPGGGGTQRLARIVGVRKAKEMIYTGELISAEEALELGLVSRVVRPEELPAEASRIIERLMSKSRKKITLAKRAVNEGLSMGLAAGLKLESGLYSEVLSSPETKEEIKNFLHRHGGG